MTQFASAPYLLMIAIACIVHFALPGPRSRSLWLFVLGIGLVASLSLSWAGLLCTTIVVTYLAALGMAAAQRTGTPRGRVVRSALYFGAIAAVIGSLVVFKYLGFIAALGNRALETAGASALFPITHVALPIGISFWTFQAVAYLVDVRRGVAQPVRSIVQYASAVAFVPIVTSGPITRIQHLVPQLQQRHRFEYGQMQSGLLLIGRGFFKKLMVADYLAVFVGSVFSNPRQYAGSTHGLLFGIAAAAFAFQLYCDFSGYTDIVRGSARLFGIYLPVNFAAPYFARSVQDFWRRWHITLMDWLRDYVYIPLGGNRRGRARRYANVMAVFLISGLWHGAGIHFVVWGALNGLYQIIGELTAPLRDKLAELLRVDRDTAAHHVFQTVATFGLVTIAWVFFRANSTGEAVYMVRNMFIPTVWILVDGTIFAQGLTPIELVVAGMSLVVVLGMDWWSLGRPALDWLNRQHVTFRWASYITLITVVLVFGRYGGSYAPADFLYYRF